jgi:hypothetical protein
LDLNLRKKLVKCYIWSMALYGAETWTLRRVDQKCMESFEMCWRRMEKISWTDRVRNEEILHRVKEMRNILRTIKRRKVNWIGHILRGNCLPSKTCDWRKDSGKDRSGRKTRKNNASRGMQNWLNNTDRVKPKQSVQSSSRATSSRTNYLWSTRERTHASAVRSRKRTSWAMARLWQLC